MAECPKRNKIRDYSATGAYSPDRAPGVSTRRLWFIDALTISDECLVHLADGGIAATEIIPASPVQLIGIQGLFQTINRRQLSLCHLSQLLTRVVQPTCRKQMANQNVWWSSTDESIYTIAVDCPISNNTWLGAHPVDLTNLNSLSVD